MHRPASATLQCALVAGLLAATGLGAGCGAATVTTGLTGQGQTVAVTVSPDGATVVAGGRQRFAASVTGTADTSVTWSVQEGAAGGTVVGGDYAAPAAPGTFHVVATSVADPTRSGSAEVVVTPPSPISVSVTPATGTVLGCQSLALSATVTGGTGSRAVAWSILDGPGNGTVSPAGVYTAPDGQGTVTVVATSVADPTRSGSATLTVTTPVLSVAIDPPTITVPVSGTAQFTATVTTTCGATVALKLVDAAGNVTGSN